MAVWTVVSAPAVRVIGVQLPVKVSQVPLVSAAESRSMVWVERSRPEPVSVPASRVSGTEVVLYQGPPLRSMLWPVGAVVSGVRVNAEVAVRPLLLVVVMVLSPLAVSVAVQV